MPSHPLPATTHFAVEPLADGAYACIHRPGGAAYSNAGIVDLGNRTLVVDALHTMAAGRALRQAAEALLARPVDALVLTHAHSDHWIGASAFPVQTVLWSSAATDRGCRDWGPKIVHDFQSPEEWLEWREETERRLATETDLRLRASLEGSLAFIGHVTAEMAEYQPRYPDRAFDETVTLEGSTRTALVRSLGRGHSEDDAVVLLPEEGIAFIGDIGFFHTQPFLGAGDLDLYRGQLLTVRDSGFRVLVPGHGPVGDRQELELQLQYMEVIEERVGRVVQRGGSLDEALRIALPQPFDGWLVGGMDRFEANVRAIFVRWGGELPPGE